MADPHFDAQDRERIHREMDRILDGALSMGPNVRAFEEEFAAMVGVKHAVATSSCTAALEISLQAAGLRRGDEVIIPAETFVATGQAVRNAGCTPIFAEIRESTFCLDLDDVIRRVTPTTKAILLVHMAGLITPDIEKFRGYCDANGLILIEDAAHSPGAVRNGRGAGSFGHAGCFSFYPTKVMTSGEGGMLTTDDDEMAAIARSLQHRGRDMNASAEEYRLPGRNVRMTEITALLGRVQLSHLKGFLAQRRLIGAAYERALVGERRVTLIAPDEPEASSYWKLPLLLENAGDRAAVIEGMCVSGVAVDAAYQPPLHLQPVFRELYRTAEGQLPRTEDLLARHLCLPCHPRMSEADALYVAHSLIEVLDTLPGGR